MDFLNFLGLTKKGIQVFAFYGPSGTGKSFRAKLVAQRHGIKAIIDDGLLIYDDQIMSGHSAKLEQTYMGAVRVALFDGKEERDEAVRAIRRLKLKKLLILGTSEKMAGKIAVRLQLPPIEKFIHIKNTRRLDDDSVVATHTHGNKLCFETSFVAVSVTSTCHHL